MVRSPRFEPGSSAWQADVLDHFSGNSHHDISETPITRLRPHSDTQHSSLLIKPIPQEIDSKIANTLIRCQNDALTPITVKAIEYAIRQLAQHANLLVPEDVKHYIANATNTKTKKPVANETKNRLCYSYDKFCKYNNIQWNEPYYRVEEKAMPYLEIESITPIQIQRLKNENKQIKRQSGQLAQLLRKYQAHISPIEALIKELKGRVKQEDRLFPELETHN